MFVFSVSITSPGFVALHLPVSEVGKVLPEVVYCCFTRTKLFTTMFTRTPLFTKLFTYLYDQG